jgi:hypothetical protein
MKNKIMITIVTLILCSCSVLRNYDTDGLTYEGTNIYYNGELAATLGAVEIAYDNKKIVYEATFILTSEKFNPKAINIIKFASNYHRDNNWEIEVELKPKQR